MFDIGGGGKRGGAKKDAGQSRDSILAQAARAREQRTVAQTQLTAARKVQAVVRSWSSRRHSFADVLKSWDAKVSDLGKIAQVLQASGKALIVPSKVLMQLGRQYRWISTLHSMNLALDKANTLSSFFETSYATSAPDALSKLAAGSDTSVVHSFASAVTGWLVGSLRVLLRHGLAESLAAPAADASDRVYAVFARISRVADQLFTPAVFSPSPGAVYTARLVLASPSAATALEELQCALLQACARTDAAAAIARVYSHPAAKLLLSCAFTAVCDAPESVSSRAMLARACGTLAKAVLPLPLLAQHMAGQLMQVAASPAWSIILEQLRVTHASSSTSSGVSSSGGVSSTGVSSSGGGVGGSGSAASPMAGTPTPSAGTGSAQAGARSGTEVPTALDAVLASFTLGNVVEAHTHNGTRVVGASPSPSTSLASTAASTGAFVEALGALLHKAPHVLFALRGAADARDKEVHRVQEIAAAAAASASASPAALPPGFAKGGKGRGGAGAGGTPTKMALERAETEGFGGAGAAEDEAIEYGETAEALQSAADRSAELAVAIARRAAAAGLADAVNSNGVDALESQASNAAKHGPIQAHVPSFLMPSTGGSFSGSSGHIAVFGLGLGSMMGKGMSVTAKLQQGGAGAGAGSLGGSGAGKAGAAGTPARAARVKAPSIRERTCACVSEHTVSLLSLRPLHVQLAAVVSPAVVGSMLQHAGAAGPLQAVEALSLLQSMQEKLRLAGYLRFTARVVAGREGQEYVCIEAGADLSGASQQQQDTMMPAATSLLQSFLLPASECGMSLPDLAEGAGPAVSLLQAAWRAVSAHPELRRYTQVSASDALHAYPALGSALTLLQEAVAWAAETVDDSSWCDAGVPLPLADTRAFLGCTRAMLYRLAWADRTAQELALSRRPYPVLSLLGACMGAFNSIYDRHVRRPGWLAGSQAKAAAGEVEQGDALFLWPPLSPADLSVKSIMGIEDVAVADEGLHAPSTGEEGGAGAAQHEEGRLAALEAAAVANADAVPEVDSIGIPAASSLRILRSNRVLLILTTCPQVIPFPTRVGLFNGLRDAAKDEEDWDGRGAGFTVRRTHLLADSFRAFTKINAEAPAMLKRRLRIQFVNTEGLNEGGIDAGGLMKEFVDCVVREAFRPETALFRPTPGGRVYPNPDPLPATPLTSGAWDEVIAARGGDPPTPAELYEFLGQLLGKALFDGILVEPRFAPYVLRRLLGKSVAVDDLAGYDVELYRSLTSLARTAKEATAAGLADPIQDLGLAFSVTDEVGGHPVTVPLVPGGDDIPVTAANLRSYIGRMARYKLHTCVAPQVRAFLRGFRTMIPLPWMRMFGAGELAVLIGGRETAGFDVLDLRSHCEYQGYTADHPTIHLLWKVVGEMTPDEQAAFLAFVTSVPRPPLLGFATLQPRFGIQVIGGAEEGMLPKAATCFNTLKLPSYKSEQVLREKLLYAIKAGAGFELT